MRSVLRQAGIKPRRWLRDHISAERRKARRALVRIAGWCPQHLSPATGVSWSDVEFYEAPIPRSLRADFRNWKWAQSKALELVVRELKEKLSP